MPERQPISVLVVCYNHADEIAYCVDAALLQRGPDIDVQVVVADNGSTDATRAVLSAYSDRITLLERDNDGFAAGVNAAFDASTGDPVLLLNPDAVMDPGCLATLAVHLRENAGAGAAAAMLRDLDGTPQRFARRDPDLAAVAWCFTDVGRRVDERRGERAARHRRYEDEWTAGLRRPLAVDCPAAACLLIRRELLEPRPLDPDFPLFFNDADLARRIRARGLTLDVVPAAGAAHGYGTSIRRAERLPIRAEWVVALRRYMRHDLGPLGRVALWGILVLDALTAGVRHALRRGDDATLSHFRGTLGGLGLPGGPPPWLTPVRRVGLRRRVLPPASEAHRG